MCHGWINHAISNLCLKCECKILNHRKTIAGSPFESKLKETSWNILIESLFTGYVLLGCNKGSFESTCNSLSICIVIFTECEKMASSKKGKKKRQKSKLPAAPFKLSSEDLMTLNLSGIRSEALIGRRSSYIVLAIVCEWQTKDKRPQRSNVKAKNL